MHPEKITKIVGICCMLHNIAVDCREEMQKSVGLLDGFDDGNPGADFDQPVAELPRGQQQVSAGNAFRLHYAGLIKENEERKKSKEKVQK